MSNEILKFCETSTGTNLLTQAEYLADAQRVIGNQPGIARDKFVNKVLRQSSFISKVFADYLIQQTGGTVLDDANDAVLLEKITSTFATGLPIASIVDMTIPQIPTGFLKCNGAAISRATYPALFAALVTAQPYTLQTFTVTIATPAVVTKTAHGFTGGERLRLSTTGTLPTGLDNTTDYFVFYVDVNTFRLQTMSNVLAKTFVNTSSSQSGTHSYIRSLWGLGDGSTTFSVPDLRGVFRRSWDDGRGIDPSRAIASLQLDMVGPHEHNVLYRTSGGGGVGNLGAAGGGSYTVDSNPTTQIIGIQTETTPKNYALMPVIKF